MDLRECQILARAVADQYNDTGDPFRGLARILEECGEVSAEIARLEQAGSKGFKNDPGDLKRLEDELADVLINIAGLANTYNLELDAAMERKHQRFVDASGRGALQTTSPEEGAKRVTVYCSSSDWVASTYKNAAARFGKLLGESGHTLVYGGGQLGLMGEVSRSARAAGGQVIGVIFDQFVDIGGDNSHVHELRVVSTMRSRKRGLADPADCYVALPGGMGTLEELLEVISFKIIKIHQRPIILLNTNGFFDPLLKQFERCYEEKFAAHYGTDGPTYLVAQSPEEAITMIQQET